MSTHLMLRLEAPLMSFGATAVDHRRPVQPWPAVSMLTGLLANALGLDRIDGASLDRLQARIRWAARIDRPGVLLNDFQTAQLAKDDRGWTTRGLVETRGGGDSSYDSPHLRLRDFRADASVVVALRLDPETESPNLEDLALALDAPRRPLFLGRKGCPPATRISLGLVNAADALVALDLVPAAEGGDAPAVATIYFNNGAAIATPQHRVHSSSDERRFDLDVHAGRQAVFERVRKAAA